MWKVVSVNVKSWRTRMVSNTMFFYHVVDLDQGVEILFEKEGATE